MRRSLFLGMLGCAAVFASPTPASAQLMRGGFFGPGFNSNGFNSNAATAANFMFGNRFSVAVGSGIGPGVGYGYTLRGPIGYGIYRQRYSTEPGFLAPSYNGYMTGSVRANDAAAQNFALAQRQAGLRNNNFPGARNTIYDQWAYEKLGVVGLPGVKPGEDAPAALLKALSGASEAEIASGEALNHIVVGIVAAEAKGKADSAFLPPNLLEQVRFGGSPTADGINLIRQAGKLNFPAAFSEPALTDLRPNLERDLAAAAAPILLGKPADPAKVNKLGADVAKARAVLDPITRDLEFEDATTARRFLNQLDSAVSVMKGANTSGLIDPRWTTEGTSVADFVKHITKNKLLFGPAPKGEEEAYIALHRGLATYLFTLTESAKPKK